MTATSTSSATTRSSIVGPSEIRVHQQQRGDAQDADADERARRSRVVLLSGAWAGGRAGRLVQVVGLGAEGEYDAALEGEAPARRILSTPAWSLASRTWRNSVWVARRASTTRLPGTSETISATTVSTKSEWVRRSTSITALTGLAVRAAGSSRRPGRWRPRRLPGSAGRASASRSGRTWRCIRSRGRGKTRQTTHGDQESAQRR